MNAAPAPAAARRGRLAAAAPYALLALLAAALFGRVVLFEFVQYDDQRYVTENAAVRAGLTAASVRWALTTTYDGNWFPLTWLSHLADVQVFGVRPAGHHAVNLLLHLANVLLLAGFLAGLTGRRRLAFAAAAVFAVHPLQVETVAWVSQRRGLLMTLFGLLALHAWLRHARRPGAGAYAALLALFACGLMAKALLVTLPLVLLLLDYWPLGRFPALRGGGAAPAPAGAGGAWRPLLEKLPLFALAAAAGVVAIRAQEGSGAMSLEGTLGLAQKALHAPAAALWYLRAALWPSGLAVFYPYPAGGTPPGAAAAGALALLALTAAALVLRRRAPALLVGWLWYLVPLLPVLGLLQVGEQAWADRYAYASLPGVPIALAGAAGLLAAGRPRLGRLLPWGALLAVAALAAVTASQLRHWRDSEALFTRALAATPENFVAMNNLGSQRLAQGRLEEAGRLFRASVSVRPGLAGAYGNLGIVAFRQGNYREAADWYREALRREPGSAPLWRSLGTALARLGRHQEAVDAFRRGLRIDGRDAAAVSLLGISLMRSGDLEGAVRAQESAAALDPKDVFIRGNLDLARGELARARAAGAR